jgi:hypothetical protein
MCCGGASSNAASDAVVRCADASDAKPPGCSTNPATTAPATKTKEDQRKAVL